MIILLIVGLGTASGSTQRQGETLSRSVTHRSLRSSTAIPPSQGVISAIHVCFWQERISTFLLMPHALQPILTCELSLVRPCSPCFVEAFGVRVHVRKMSSCPSILQKTPLEKQVMALLRIKIQFASSWVLSSHTILIFILCCRFQDGRAGIYVVNEGLSMIREA